MNHRIFGLTGSAASARVISLPDGAQTWRGAWRTISGYEAMHMIRKGQACWSAAGAKVGLLHRVIVSLFAATN